MMDLRTVMIASSLLLMTAASDHGTLEQAVPQTSPVPTNSCTCNSSCPCATPAATVAPVVTPSPPASALGLLMVRWTGDCDGDVVLVLHRLSTHTSPVCYDSEKNVHSMFTDVCQYKRGCKNKPRWQKGADRLRGYDIKESGAEERTDCETLRVHCTVEVLADTQGELQGYKVVIALLCCVLVVLLLIRFTRPTINALQKRLSDRRQNRWIGPTQSHSVSYHRGKTVMKNIDEEKRLSYPALERLTVTESREPSSNRNSDYNY